MSESLRECAERAGTRLGVSELQRLESYLRLLERWNRAVRLTALPLDGFPAPTLDRLIGEALAAAPLVPRTGDWLDLASGGGSPAIPLKVVRPDLALTMVEARHRKAAFLRETARELALSDTKVLAERFEEVSGMSPADLVTARAVRLDETFFSVVAAALRPSGCLVLFTSEGSPLPQWDGLQLVRTLAFAPTRSKLLCYRIG